MTQEEKQLLIKDLSERLSCRVIIQVYFEDISADGYFDEELWSLELDGDSAHVNDRWIENIKPYLRPMSSMTEDERDEATQFEINNLGPIGFNWGLLVSNSYKLVNWLNEHHFDVRGLIHKGLAFEAPEGMYKTE